MFTLIKMIIYLVGAVTITYFALPYFGYEFNTSYLSESREKCEEKLKECKDQIIMKGLENPKCDPRQCIDRKLIIKKK